MSGVAGGGTNSMNYLRTKCFQNERKLCQRTEPDRECVRRWKKLLIRGRTKEFREFIYSFYGQPRLCTFLWKWFEKYGENK